MTYSRCCHRHSILRRFPTRGLPATAPTSGSASGATSRPTVSGTKIVSPSTRMITSCRA